MDRVEFGSPLTILGVVKDKPLQSRYKYEIKKETTGGLITRAITGSVFRDSFGRTRKDVTLEIVPGVHLLFAHVYDPIARNSYLLDNTNETVTEEVFRVDGEISQREIVSPTLPEALGMAPETEVLGQAEIDAVPCHGYRLRLHEVQVEFWLSHELNAVILEERSAAGETSRQLLFDISRAEPNEKLFAIPADYVRVQARH